MSLTRYKSLTDIFSGNKHVIFYIFILNILLFIPAALEPIFKRVFADYIITDGVTEWLPSLVLLMLGTAMLSAFITFMNKSCLLRLSNKIEISGYSRYMWTLLRSPLSLFHKKDSLRLISQAEASKGIANLLTRDFLELLFNLSSVIFYLIMMIRLDYMMATIVVALVVLIFIMSKLQQLLRSKLSPGTGQHPKLTVLERHDERISFTGLKNIETFKSTASETYFFQRLLGSKISIINAKQNHDIEEAYSPVEDLPVIVFLNILLLISALRMMDHSFSPGLYLAFQTYASAFFIPLSSVLSARKSFRKFGIHLQRFNQELDNGKDASPREDVSAASTGKLNGYIELKDVCFGYEHGAPVLQNISLSVTPGQRIALLGNSGSGKTTLLKLLQGMYEPDSGEIYIDGVNPARMDKRLFVNSIGCANQDITLFSASVRDNITLWDESVSDAEMYRAARDACIHEHISSLKGAYAYHLSENGNNLSRDQMQRLEISRALLYNPSVVLLDEVTGAIDSISRMVIARNLVNRGCTCVSAANMISQIMDYDEIIIMENGRITHRGTHDMLMRSSGLYLSMLRDERAVTGI